MNLNIIWFIILGFSNCCVKSEILEFVSNFIVNNNEVGYGLFGITTSDFAQTGLSFISSDNNFLESSFSILNADNPITIIVSPRKTSDLISIFNKIGEIYSHILQNKFWKSNIFIIWPAIIEKDTGLKHVSDILTSQVTNTNISLNIQEVFLSVDERKLISNYFPKAVRRQNFNKANILAGGLRDPNYEYQLKLIVDDTGSVEFVSGIAANILHALQYALNFSYTAVIGEGWIEQLENGTWTGIAKQIRNGEVDLGISQSSFLPYRAHGLSYLHATSFGHVKAFFRQPLASSIRDIYLSNFKLDLWISLLISWILLITCMILFYFIRLKYTPTEIELCDKEIVDECILWIIGSLCQQGWYNCPSALSMKIPLLCSSIIGLVYYIAFSAALVSTLSVDIVPIRSINDLAESNLEIWGDSWLPNTRTVVKSITEKQKRVVKLVESEQYMEIHTAIPKLLKRSSAYLTYSDGFLTVLNHLNYSDHFYCDTFSAVGVMKAPHLSGMIVKKGSPYKEVFNHKILMMRERGLNARFNQHYAWGTVAMCPRRISKYGDKLGIYDLFTAYFILFGGYFICCICISLECFIFIYVFK